MMVLMDRMAERRRSEQNRVGFYSQEDFGDFFIYLFMTDVDNKTFAQKEKCRPNFIVPPFLNAESWFGEAGDN